MTRNGGFHLFAVSLLARFDRVVEVIFLPSDHLTALVHQVVRAVLQSGRLFLQIFLTFVGFVQQHIACFAARFRGEQHAYADADSQSQEKVCQSVSVHFALSSRWALSTSKAASPGSHCATHSITALSAQQAKCHAESGKLQYIVPGRKTVRPRTVRK